MDKVRVTKYLKLPINFDIEKLVFDLNIVLNDKWVPHFNTDGYSGNWNVIPLYAINGNESNIYAFQTEEAGICETRFIKTCFYFKKAIQSFRTKILSARLLKLGVGAEIKPHRDHNLGYENNTFRLHIPITTNNDVQFILDGERIVMNPGECWYTNVNYIHSVSNKGNSDRIHLVIDGERNAWTDDLFFSMAPRDSFFPKNEEQFDEGTIIRVIEELRRSDLPIAEQLIRNWQEKLN